MAPRELSGVCSATNFPNWVGPFDPGRGNATGTKVAEGASSFGDLSGNWMVPLPSGGCTFQFEGATFNADCGASMGGMRMTFCGSIASGTTTRGIEFSARRR